MKNNKERDPELQKELDTLQKSLKTLEIPADEIEKALKKAEDKYMKEKGDDNEKDPENGDALQKSLEGLFKALGDRMEKALTKGFEDLKGNLPGTTATPSTSLNKSIEGGEDDKNKDPEDKEPENKEPEVKEPENKEPETKTEEPDIEKSLNNKFSEFGAMINGLTDLVKCFGEKQSTLEKSFNEFLDAPVQRPQAVRGSYQTIEKGIRTDNNGSKVVSYANPNAVMSVVESAVSKTSDPLEKKMVNDAIVNFNVCKSLNSSQEGLVTRLTGVQFEK